MKINKIIEYCAYFLALLLSAWLFYLSRGIFGLEHLLSTMQVGQGLTPFLDFFEHHGPLLYYIFAPIYNLVKIDNFPLTLIIINSGLALFCLHIILSKAKLKIIGRIILACLFIIFWTILEGASFMPEPYIAFLAFVIYWLNDKRVKNYLIYSGIIIGLIFLIKFNAAFLIGAAWLINELINYKTTLAENFRKIILLISGALMPVVIFLIIFAGAYKEVYFWLFQYNAKIVAPLIKQWPPHFLSLFYLLLAINLLIIIQLIKNKLITPALLIIGSSLFLILLAYPRYGEGHLLPAFISMFLGLVLVAKHLKIKNLFINKYLAFINGIIILFIIVSTIYFVNIAYIATKKILIPADFYSANFIKQDQDFITKESGCSAIYIYPGEPLMYLKLPQIKRSFFAYPHFSWTFNKGLEEYIMNDISTKKIKCFIVRDKAINKDKIRNAIEELILKSKLRTKEISWDKYGSLGPFRGAGLFNDRVYYEREKYILYY